VRDLGKLLEFRMTPGGRDNLALSMGKSSSLRGREGEEKGEENGLENCY